MPNRNRYDIAARNLFLATIKPPSLFWRFMAQVILVVTDGVFLLERFIGYNNLVSPQPNQHPLSGCVHSRSGCPHLWGAISCCRDTRVRATLNPLPLLRDPPG